VITRFSIAGHSALDSFLASQRCDGEANKSTSQKLTSRLQFYPIRTAVHYR
jgi:hypothetical protein